MRSIAFIISFVLLCFSSAFGAVMIGSYNDPRYPGKCTIKDDLILSPGQIVKDPDLDCGRILCGGNGMAEIQTCGLQMVAGCKLGDYVDKSLPYPECCKREIICN